MSEKQLWSSEADNTHKKQKFKDMSGCRKFLYLMIMLALAAGCFLIGHRVSDYLYKQELASSDVYVYGVDYKSGDDNYVPTELTGIKTLLIIGCDTREGDVVARSDTLMVAFLNMDTHSVDLLSIPRDSYVRIPGYGTSKINHAFAYGGVALSKATMEYLLGITIDDYVIIDFNGFKDVVDALGGVEIDVDMDMYNYAENIDVKKGLQVLNGKDALGYVRYRGSDCSDYQRIRHQQNFLRALIDKLLSFSSLTKMASLINIGMTNVTTSLTAYTAKDYASYALQMDLANMNVYTVQGNSMYLLTDGLWISYEMVDVDSLTSILNQIAGDGFTFNPNVVTDNGEGRYSLPENESDPEDDLFNSDETLNTVVDDGSMPENTDGQNGTAE